MGAVEERRRARQLALERARRFAKCVEKVVAKPLDAVVFGSYARGDFGEWSDIDLLIIAEGLPKNLLERLKLAEKCLSEAPDIEPLILEPDEVASRLL